jgi:hypothetical protein
VETEGADPVPVIVHTPLAVGVQLTVPKPDELRATLNGNETEPFVAETLAEADRTFRRYTFRVSVTPTMPFEVAIYGVAAMRVVPCAGRENPRASTEPPMRPTTTPLRRINNSFVEVGP